ncbi:MAG TPA: cobalamin-binding protein [Terriglobia bacterium]|nr:cobalamin-binding protein [Terriglobia bacterium]
MLLLMLLLALAPSHRIVSVAPSITEILFALGAGDQVVGDTTYCNFPEAAKTKSKVGGYTTPSLEAILALRPDQVIMMKNRPDVAQKLRQTGIDVVELQPENLAGIYESIQVIAGKIGVPARGQALIQSIRKQLEGLSTGTTGPKPKVLFIVGRTPGTTADLIAVGRGSYLNELIGLAGGENILADTTVPYPKANMEEIIRRNPDVIIDMGHSEMVSQSQKQAVKQLWKKYPFLRAVQRDAVFPISADYFVTPGPRVVQAVGDIRKMIAMSGANASPIGRSHQ